MVGAHVQHNTYFVDFPANVPDTVEFWWSCVAGALADEATRVATYEQMSTGVIDLLTLPAYGRYQHTYEEMLAAHSELVQRALLAGLDTVVAAAPARLADVNGHHEEFKRLGERLHPHEYPRWPHAASVFAVARGEAAAPTFDSRVEQLLAQGDVTGALRVLSAAPDRLLRAPDRLLRGCATQAERDAVVAAASQAAQGASGRVLLAVREHFLGRGRPASATRVFVNRRGAAWAISDERRPVPVSAREQVVGALDAEIARRLPRPERLLIDPHVLDVALPLSGRVTTGGFGVLPRGSVSPVDGNLLRFFVYWKQARERTDFDLSAQLLDSGYNTVSWLSYTQLTQVEGEHSGDIADALDSASEFINLWLGAVRSTFIVPQVHIYSGEGSEEVEESFFGFMLREREQQGQPFEARTVRMKSELRGPGRAALPLAFVRGRDGDWHAKWLHLYLRGMPGGNRVEAHKVTVAGLLRSVVERKYLTVRWLTERMAGQGTVTTMWDGANLPDGPVTYIGMEQPEGLHPDSVVITPQNLRALIPE